MVKYSEIKNNEVQFLALTSLTVNEFEILLVHFQACWEYNMKYFTFDGKQRERAYSEKSNGILPLVEDKLFFIMYYLKNNLLQETLASNFNVTQPQANKCIYRYKTVLFEALECAECLPARNRQDLKKLLSQSEEVEFYADGVERLIPRNTDWDVQKDQYSGKKKTHTDKNVVFSDSGCKICYLSDTEEGKTHDKKIADTAQVELPENSTCFLDTGFVGYQPNGSSIAVVMPTKKTKGKKLNDEEKKQNKKIAQVRVKVEHVMSGIKRLRIVKDRIRLRVSGIRDSIMEIACALHNFRLLFRPWNYPDTKKILQS